MSATEDVIELSLRYSECQRENADLRAKAADAKAIAVEAVAGLTEMRRTASNAMLRADVAEEKLARMHEAAADVVELWMSLKDPDDIVFERRICDLEEMIPSAVLAKRRIMRPDEERSTSGPPKTGA